MSSYTEEELKGMTRVELRRAAIDVLKIDNKECSNTKSQELIERIMSEQGGGGKATQAKTRGAPAGRQGRVAPKEDKEETPPRETKGGGGGGGDVAGRVDAVGKTVDEGFAGLAEQVQQILDNQAETQRQNFQIFGLLTDLYKFTGEPDELEERLNELDQEWEAQGNESSGG